MFFNVSYCNMARQKWTELPKKVYKKMTLKSAHCELGTFDKRLPKEFKAVKPAKLNSLKI